jgi:DNA processing protein
LSAPFSTVTSQDAYLLLNAADGIGPRRVRSLLARFGTPEAVFAASAAELSGVDGIGEKSAAALLSAAETFSPEEERARAADCGARILTPADAEYPAPLREIPTPPLALYVRGTLSESDANSIAVVGTRTPSHYGVSQADRIAFQLARSGLTVVSGCARGIDTAAHRGALKAGGRTVAFIGAALDCFYPPENRALADEIAASGAVVSEFRFGVGPAPSTFPNRNRLIAGLALGTLVIEAGERSGSLQTARHALDQGRTVMALPGRVDVDTARGPNSLIREGAVLVRDARDVLEEFSFVLPDLAPKAAASALDPRRALDVSEDEKKVLAALWKERELPVDEVIRATGIPAAKLLPLVLRLEMKKLVRMRPARRIALAEGLDALAEPDFGGTPE